MRIVVPTEGGSDMILIEGSARELEHLAEGCTFAAGGPDRRAEGQCLHPDGLITFVVQLTPCRRNLMRQNECNRGTQGCDINHEGE